MNLKIHCNVLSYIICCIFDSFLYFNYFLYDRYLNAEFTLMLPPNRKVSDLSWFSVFDIDENSVYGDIFFPEGFEPPTHQYLQPLEGFSNGVK